MTDPGSVVAAYAVVVGGLLLYVGSITRRVRAARRLSDLLERERQRDLPIRAGARSAGAPGQSGPTA